MRGTLSFFCLNINARNINVMLTVLYEVKSLIHDLNVTVSYIYLGDNRIQICHLGRYIVGYTVRIFVLRRRDSGAVKHDFRTYIRRYTSPNDKLEYGYPHSNVLFKFYTFATKTLLV